MSEPPVLDGVTHRWVEARGFRFHVAEAGEGDDPVLLLHLVAGRAPAFFAG